MFSTEALERPPSAEEMRAAREHRKATSPGAKPLVIGLIAVVAALIFANVAFNVGRIVLEMFTPEGEGPGLLAWVVWGLPVLLAATIVTAAVRNFRGLRRREAHLLAFARANGLDYLPEQSGVPEDLHATVLRQGDRQKVLDLVRSSGQLKALGTLRWTSEGSGDSSDSHYELGFMTWRLPRRLPQVVIDQRDRRAASTATATHLNKKSQTLSMGEPFDSRFTIFVPAGVEQAAFQLFPPNVLEKLMQLSPGWDVEILGDELSLFASQPFELESPRFWRSVEEVGQGLVSDISRISQRMIDSKVREHADVVAFGSQVLARRRFSGAGIGCLVVFGVFFLSVLAFVVYMWSQMGR
ncbi:hypothetical protein M3G03_01840 [Aestuariimicrobium sp. p3-SID1156]|uniref:hypothetical protein n=1 Tax=Aestuariimicrobium sp. p3-SID1156 TaxID=2916038 RepID=UPI00223C3E16|nr:hypothetical protein [Aestuariimicrobium sp. p3-SID1156]MCT1458295.1 hypothetical protein [Aestuariimicrobium sp. p3-SID1156]